MSSKADRIADEVAETLKQQGFKKRRRTWSRDLPDVIQVFNIQASQWSKNDFYINVGIYIKALGDLSSPPENKCHVRDRVPHDDIPSILEYSLAWLDDRRTNSDLRGRTVGGDSREMVSAVAREYLEGLPDDR